MLNKSISIEKATLDELIKLRNDSLKHMISDKTLDPNDLARLSKYVKRINNKIKKLDEKNKEISKNNDYLDLF